MCVCVCVCVSGGGGGGGRGQIIGYIEYSYHLSYAYETIHNKLYSLNRTQSVADIGGGFRGLQTPKTISYAPLTWVANDDTIATCMYTAGV